MKKRISIFAIAIASTAIAHAVTNDLTGLLQKGLFEEEANRNLDAAISNYQSLANAFDKDRQVAATAIFRLGECYRKLGRTNEAAAQYERIVREFNDQQTLVTLSQQNLAGLGHPGQPAAEQQGAALSEQARELEIVKKLQAMPLSEILQAGPTLLTDATLINLIYQYNQTELDLIRLRTDHAEGHSEVQKEKAIQSALQDKIRERLNGLARALSLESGTVANLPEKSTLSRESTSTEQAPITDEEEKEIRRIQVMIQNSPDLINVGGSGPNGYWTPLYQAARSGWLRVATFLLDHGANIEAVTLKADGTALDAAARSGNKAMVELLLSRGADVNATGYLQAPLHIAAEKGFVAVCETLMNHKADVNVRDSDMRTPLHLAAQAGQLGTVKLLLARGADLNPKDLQGYTPLLDALRSDRPAVAESLLGAKPDVNVVTGEGVTALSYAAMGGHGEIVKLLLEAKADPNGGTTNLPLAVAIEFSSPSENRSNICWMLLRAGADPNTSAPLQNRKQAPFQIQQQNSPGAWSSMALAVDNRQADVVKLLLDYKGNPNEPLGPRQGEKVLMRAVSDGNVDIAKALLAHGADVNARDALGETALTYAIWSTRPEMVELLINNKADVNVQDTSGKTPLNVAKEMQRSAQPASSTSAGEIVMLLRQHGALDELPNFDAIRVTREGLSGPIFAFQRQTNDWNHYTLLETILQAYSGNSWVGNQFVSRSSVLKFPDLRRIIIHRPNRTSLGKQKEITVNLLNSTNGIDCGKDVRVEFGDTVEIPIRDYSLGEEEVGLTHPQSKDLRDCLKTTVRLVVRGESRELTPNGWPPFVWTALQLPEAKSLLLASSDLAHVKVTRKDPSTGKTREFIVDATADHGFQDLRLQNGDTIEVPEKTRE